MRKYETIFIINPDLSEEDVKGLIEKVKSIVESLQGEVLRIEDWGRKRLAYEVKRTSRGLFVLLHFMGTVHVVAELERNFRLMDPVLKYQTVRLDEKTEKAAQMLSRERTVETAEKEGSGEEIRREKAPEEGGEKKEAEEKKTSEETPTVQDSEEKPEQRDNS